MLTKQSPRKQVVTRPNSKPPAGRGLIIEFAGPTGCGKTTNCRYFSERLAHAGLKTYEFRDVKKYLNAMPASRRILLYLRSITKNFGKLFNYWMLLAASGVFNLDATKRYIKLCIFDSAAQAFMRNHHVDVLLLDQWIVQGLWSATIFRARTYSSLQERLPRFYFAISYLLFFDLDEETACQRIASRQFGRSRFDRMDHAGRLIEMKRYQAYLRMLYENSTCTNKLIFSAKTDPQENAEAFLKYLQRALHKTG